TRIARFGAYLAAVDLVFLVLSQALQLASFALATATILRAWVGVFNFFLIYVALVLAWRWVRQHLMWRLRNRLIVTYVFIGVIPVLLLVSMAGIAGYLFAGQFATFLATEDVRAELDKLDASSAVISTEIAGELREDDAPAEAAKMLRQGASVTGK